MTRDDVIRMAREFCPAPDHMGDYSLSEDDLVRFAAIVEEAGRAAEREACAKTADDFLTQGRSPLGRRVAEAIRARGKA